MPATERPRRVLEHLETSVAPTLLRMRVFERTTPLAAREVLWLVRKGLVRAQAVGRRPMLVDVFGPGSLASLGDRSGRAQEALVADAGTEVVEIGTDGLVDLGRRHPEVVAGIALALDRQRAVLRERVAVRQRGRVADQLAAGLDLLAGEVGVPCSRGLGDHLDLVGLSHQDLADLVGSSRSYVSTTLAQLQREGWVRAEGPRHLCLGPALRLLR